MDALSDSQNASASRVFAQHIPKGGKPEAPPGFAYTSVSLTTPIEPPLDPSSSSTSVWFRETTSRVPSPAHSASNS
jgi:hypothetical protein